MTVKLSPGQSHIFTTRIIGQQTKLKAFFIDPSAFGLIGWHKELCCEDWHYNAVPAVIDISAGGALVTVVSAATNTDDLYLDTGYI